MNKTPLWLGYTAALILPVLCTLIGFAIVPRFDIVNVAMVYLLAVVGIALLFNRGAAVVASEALPTWSVTVRR